MAGYPPCQAPGHNNIMARDDKQNCYHSRITDGRGPGHWNSFKPPPIATKRASQHSQQVTNKDKRISEIGSNMQSFIYYQAEDEGIYRFQIIQNPNIDIPQETLKARISLACPNLPLPIRNPSSALCRQIYVSDSPSVSSSAWYYEAVLGSDFLLNCHVCRHRHHSVTVTENPKL